MALSGAFEAFWHVTPEELRRMADEMERGIAKGKAQGLKLTECVIKFQLTVTEDLK